MTPTDEQFIRAALAESEFPVTAGYLPPDGKPLSEADRPLLPVWGVVGNLPRWARVAFAARCARRVLPLSQAGEEGRIAAVLALAVKVTEEAARQASVGSHSADVPLLAARTVAEPARNHGDDDSQEAQPELAGRPVAEPSGTREAVYHAAYAAHIAAHPRGNQKDVTQHAIEAATAAYWALAEARNTAADTDALDAPVYTDAPARDLGRVLALAHEQHWTDDTPVPPEVFGPMWDRGEPRWWDDVFADLPADNPGPEPAGPGSR